MVRFAFALVGGVRPALTHTISEYVRSLTFPARTASTMRRSLCAYEAAYGDSRLDGAAGGHEANAVDGYGAPRTSCRVSSKTGTFPALDCVLSDLLRPRVAATAVASLRALALNAYHSTVAGGGAQASRAETR